MIYQYKCPECGEIEINHKMGEKVEKCPHCGKEIKRIYSSGNFILNGKNWAKDNYGLKEK